ncbi:MAG TPA: protein kinase [Thermoanaerobaculia bacterium]|nr:protein kinase [Thermoanaerobaculia bacterium]
MSDERSLRNPATDLSAETVAREPVSPACPLAKGVRLGRYRILRPLGAGGMGEVYVAEDERLGRQVAVKVIRSSRALSPLARARFEQEACAASALTHPNIITIHDIGDDGDQPFIVMELLEGRSLRDTLRERLPAGDLLRLALQMTDALSAAHERGIVHRDLKPENIFVTSEGNAKILDFGVARIRPQEIDEDAATHEQLTMKGSAIGTAGYMAPEVIAGQPADVRADVFSLGCMLYEMAAGRRAFEGRNVIEVLAASLREDPAPLQGAREDLPPAFSLIVEKSLQKDPAARYSSIRELREDLLALAAAVQGGRVAERGRSLPQPDFPLLGREMELQAIRSMIIDEKARLVTLTGPGGSGKTRLAITAAEELSDWFGGRVFFVPLAAVSEPDLVGAAMARALHAGDPSRAPLPTVIAALRSTEERSLLVIDNFEQVIEAASELAELIAACPTVVMLVTSREILHLYAERAIPVPPLPLPGTDVDSGSAETLKNPAVMLFVQRARAVNPSLDLGPANVAAIVEICRKLDGLPLAIELAAARTRLITPRAMLARIGERLKLLTGGARDLPGRQQTLRRTLDWSYELLSVGEQALLRRLSVFAGSFTLEEAEAVADPFGRLELEVVDGVGSLVDKSLLLHKGEEDGEPRFAMLGVVRDYAAELLVAGEEEEETRKAHAAYYLVLAEEGGQRPEENAGWLARIAREHDNLRAAIEWTTATGRTEWGLRIGIAIFPFWERSEHVSEGRRRFVALLANPEGADDLLRARALFSASVLACTQKDYAAATEDCQASLAMFRRLDDGRGVAVSCNCLGVVFTELRDLDRAAASFEEAISVWRSAGDEASYARTLMNLAMVRRLQGDHESARRMYVETEALFRRIGDSASAAWALNHRGDVARELERFDEASGHYSAALAAFRELGDSWGIASSLVDLGSLARRQGRFDDAHAAYRDSLEHFARVGHSRGIARVLEAMSLLAVEQEHHERALTLAGAASRIRDVHGAPLSVDEQAELDRGLDRARRALDLEGARKPYQCGRCMGVNEAIGYAIAGGN